MSNREADAALSVGELARAAGLTVRALHHYEQVGLLPAAQRTDAGHRRYGPDAVGRLYQIARLRGLGMSLDQIGQALDDPARSLGEALREHLVALDEQLARLAEVRQGVGAVLADLDRRADPAPDLLEVLSAMDRLDSLTRRRISIMVYQDLGAAHRYLTEVFGLTPGEVTTGPDGRVVHAEVFAGDGVIWLHPETEEYALASPRRLGAATATMAVIVDDVDEQHRAVRARGGDIVYGPTDQPYGYREFSARDPEGALWSFMKELPERAGEAQSVSPR